MSSVNGYLNPIYKWINTPLTSPAACVAEGDSCLAGGGDPHVGDVYVDPDCVPASGKVEYGDPVTFVLSYAYPACDGSEIKVTFELGPYQGLEMDKNEDGTYSITVPAVHWAGSSACVTVTDPIQEKTVEKCLYELPNVIQSSIPQEIVCDYDPSPVIMPGYQIQVEPATSVPEGTLVTLSFLKEGMQECDGTRDSLKVFFVIDGKEYEAVSNRDKYSLQIRFDQASPNPYRVAMKVTDPSRPDTVPQLTKEIEIYVEAKAETSCDIDPRPSVFETSPPDPEFDYDVNSGEAVGWEIFAENCDYTTEEMSAECRFGELGSASGTGDDGTIDIQKVLTKRIMGPFPCDIKGSNGAVRINGALLYPPYYQTP